MAARFRLPAVLFGLSPHARALATRAGMIAQIWYVEPRTTAAVPLMISRVSFGFPSPADDYIDKVLDLNELLARHPDANYVVKCIGDSMIGVGIYPGDLCVIDKSYTAADGDVVVAILDGDFTIKTYRCRGNRHWLQPENPAYADIEIGEESGFEVWGVVTDSIRRLRHGR